MPRSRAPSGTRLGGAAAPVAEQGADLRSGELPVVTLDPCEAHHSRKQKHTSRYKLVRTKDSGKHDRSEAGADGDADRALATKHFGWTVQRYGALARPVGEHADVSIGNALSQDRPGNDQDACWKHRRHLVQNHAQVHRHIALPVGLREKILRAHIRQSRSSG